MAENTAMLSIPTIKDSLISLKYHQRWENTLTEAPRSTDGPLNWEETVFKWIWTGFTANSSKTLFAVHPIILLSPDWEEEARKTIQMLCLASNSEESCLVYLWLFITRKTGPSFPEPETSRWPPNLQPFPCIMRHQLRTQKDNKLIYFIIRIFLCTRNHERETDIDQRPHVGYMWSWLYEV